MRLRRSWRVGSAAIVAVLAACALPVAAHAVPIPAIPIPDGPEGSAQPQFVGKRATRHRVRMSSVPRHPFMAPNGRSNLHDDAYQTDTYRQAGPLGSSIGVSSTETLHECASLTFDSKGRIVAVCVGLEGPILAMFDPGSLAVLALKPLPPRSSVSPDVLTDFSGGGYFYLDNEDRAVVSTTTRHILVIGETEGLLGPGFQTERDLDLSSVVPSGDGIISALPDWRGRIWFASKQGVVGSVNPASGTVQSMDTHEPIGNSFAVDETGGVFIVTDKALYRFQTGKGTTPRVIWRRAYKNIGVKKPGQTQAGSGTTPTLMGKRFVAITDNDDPMHILVLKRTRNPKRRFVCRVPVFRKGASNTDQSLIGTDLSMVVENNYGYSGITATMNGGTTEPGLERIDIVPRPRGHFRCRRVWRSVERAPSAVPKLSLAAGLVYTYTKPPGPDDPWYFTAIDFRTGKTVYKRLAGEGLGHNNHYAPIILGPTGTAYVATFGGIVRFRDTP